MPISQNLRFVAAVPVDMEFEHPPGCALMRGLSADLAAGGWQMGGLENWRDCGWSVVCHRNLSALEISVARLLDGEWMLQISPDYVPGFFQGWLGKKPSASASDVYKLAMAVHQGLDAAHLLGNPRWRWDGFPDDSNSTPEPRTSPLPPHLDVVNC